MSAIEKIEGRFDLISRHDRRKGLELQGEFEEPWAGLRRTTRIHKARSFVIERRPPPALRTPKNLLSPAAVRVVRRVVEG